MTAPMARGAAGAQEAAEETSEMVPASELSVGDFIMFPSSRQALEVITISEEGENSKGERVRILQAESSLWHVPSTFEVRRVLPEVQDES